MKTASIPEILMPVTRPIPSCTLRIILASAQLLIFPASSLLAATFYMAPNGADSNAGSIDAPFATIQRAQDSAAPGDTVLIRGGTYVMRNDQVVQRPGPESSCVTLLKKSGTPDKRINYWAYPGERPVFDYANVKPAEGR